MPFLQKLTSFLFRNLLLEEFFANNNPISLEGPLYLKSESKKGWKRYHFVLRQSGLYYYPKEKEKVKSSKDLMCLALFNSYNVYKGIGWKKKHKAPTDFCFALKCPKVNIPGKGMKMLCADDSDVLEKWIMCCRIAKYGKTLVENFKNLVEELAREDLDKMASTRLSFATTEAHINGDKLSTTSSQSGRLSRASSSSSSSGCLSDDNNGFDCEFTTGTIKRKPTMKPNLPLTTKTRQLIKEVDDSRNDDDPSEKGGTLTRHRSHSSSSSGGTLKRQGSNRCSIESMKFMNSASTPEKQMEKIPALSPSNDVVDNVKLMTSCMTDSMLSLPPPPPEQITCMSASSLSINSLPFPDPPDEVELLSLNESQASDDVSSNASLNFSIGSNKTLEAEPIYKTILKAPPYKSPPAVNKYSQAPPVPQKTVTFSDSPPPVVMRKKVCFDDKVEKILVSPRHEKPPPLPPLRDSSTFLTCTPKRLCDSMSNPPQDFWQDLHRVVNKKLGVAQKCKMNLQTSPGEVLGFRDAEPTYESSYYRETSTSNWVLEHYGDNLYENWDGNKGSNGSLRSVLPQNGVVLRDPNAIAKQNLPQSPQRRSTRGPPVPRRSESTRLSTNSKSSVEMQ